MAAEIPSVKPDILIIVGQMTSYNKHFWDVLNGL